MDQRRQREIARKGGQAAHQKGTAHEFTSDEARTAGRKGGEAVSSNRAHMSAIGRKGGESSHNGHKAVPNGSIPDPHIGESAVSGDERADSGIGANEAVEAGDAMSRGADAEPDAREDRQIEMNQPDERRE